MTTVKSKLEIALIVLGILSIFLGIWTMLRLQTVFVSNLYLILLYTPIIIAFSFGLGLITRKLIKSKWNKITFTLIYVTIFCVLFYITQYRTTYEITIPESFVGDVNLVVTDEAENDFDINRFGIGYITEKTYRSGFSLKIIKNGKDITKRISGLNRSSTMFITPDLNISLDYLTFIIPGNKNDSILRTFDDLLENKAIDITRIKKNKNGH